MVGVSIPILQLRVSLQQLQVLRSVLNSLSPSAKKEDEVEESGRVQGAREGEGKVNNVSEERRVLVFQDDLRNGSLTVEEQAGEGNKSKEIRNWCAELGLRLADCCCQKLSEVQQAVHFCIVVLLSSEKIMHYIL